MPGPHWDGVQGHEEASDSSMRAPLPPLADGPGCLAWPMRLARMRSWASSRAGCLEAQARTVPYNVLAVAYLRRGVVTICLRREPRAPKMCREQHGHDVSETMWVAWLPAGLCMWMRIP